VSTSSRPLSSGRNNNNRHLTGMHGDGHWTGVQQAPRHDQVIKYRAKEEMAFGGCYGQMTVVTWDDRKSRPLERPYGGWLVKGLARGSG
jgi:hypothetical protein